VRVRIAAVEALRTAGIIPVISSIGFVPVVDDADQLVNVNADTVAGEIAAAVGAERLVFLTDIDGVHDSNGQVIASLDAHRSRGLIASGTISGGMIPKVEACLHALSLGVPVQIVDGRAAGALTQLAGHGTSFEPAI